MRAVNAVEGRAVVAIRNESDIDEQLGEVLHELGRRAKGIQGSVVVDANGLAIASNVPRKLDLSVVAAVSTLITQSAADAFENLATVGPEVIIMEGAEVILAVMPLGQGNASLLALVDKTANLGLVRIEMKRAALRGELILGIRGGGKDFTIRELFVIYQNGILIRHYSDSLRTDIDRDVLSGMLTAVQQFVRETLSSKAGKLDELRYGNYTIHFIRGQYCVAAAVVDGPNVEAARYPVSDALQDFEDKYVAVLEKWDGDNHGFKDIDECFLKVLGSSAKVGG